MTGPAGVADRTATGTAAGRLQSVARRSFARRHWALGAVVVLGAVLRWAVAHDQPIHVFPDSHVYLDLAFDHDGVGFSPGRPSGYPVFLELVAAAFGRAYGAVTTVQHLAGLVTGGLVYALLLRLRAPRWMAVAGAALFLLDGYVVAMEHQLLTEALFGAVVLASVYLATATGRGPAALAASGALLASAVLIRSAGIFVVPVWLVFVAFARHSWRATFAGVAGLVAPLVVYCSLHAAAGQGFAITQADGWFLYGRVQAFADCQGARIPPGTEPLCQGIRLGPVGAIWESRSPARQLFAPGTERDLTNDYPEGMDAHSNTLLRKWATAVIIAHPKEYLRVVAAGFWNYVSPGGRAAEPEVTLPGDPSALLWFPRHVHTVRPLAGLLLVTGLVGGLLGWTRRRRGRRPEAPWRETLFLSAVAFVLLAGPVATNDYLFRFMVPALPPLLCGGLLGLQSVVTPAGSPKPEVTRAI